MRNKLAVMCLTLATMFCANAATWIDPDSGIEWTYSISNGEAKVEDLNSPSLSKGNISISDPSVEITVPRRLGGCPVTIIGNRAFSWCQGLVRVEIPDGVKTIEYSAFESCYNLRKVKIPESVTKIADGAFIYCSALEDMTLPSQMRNIEAYTFSRCFKLKRVEMGHCVTNIAWNAFEACMALEYINFPVGLRSIGENAFQYCLSLRLVMLPRSVEHLKDRSFMQCTNLMKVVVGTGIKSIGNNVFDKCENLRSVVFCGDAPVMGESVFTNVDYRCTAYVKNGADGWGEVPGKWEHINTAYLDADDNGYNGETPGTMFSWMITEYPYGAITAGPMSYNGTCPVVTIPSRISTDILCYDKDVDSLPVRTIENFTFKDCSHLKSAIIPESVVKIGTSAFEGCRSLKQIKFEGYDHLLIETKLGTNVFADVASGCTAYDSHKRLFSCVFDPVEWHYTLDSEGLLIGAPDSFKEITDEYSGGYGGMRKESQFHMMYHLTSGGIGIERYLGTESVVNIPSHLNCMGFNDPVAYIEAGAFENCGFLTEVTFSKRVKSIGSRAFYGCKSLKRVIFKGQPPRHISENAFEGVHPDCTVYVPHGCGWTVLETSTLNGLKLEYYSISKAVNEDEVAEVLAGATDPSVAKNIKSVKEYNDYQEWAMGLPGASLQQVMDSPFAWLSYVFNTENLIAAAPKEGDVVIDTFENAATDGAFEFTVNMKDIAVGDGALEANIRKVFDIEGATELRSDGTSDGGFSSDNVEVSAAVPVNGHVKFTVSPKVEKGESGTGSFFFRVRMK